MKNHKKAIKNFDTMNCNQSVLSVYGPKYGIPEELCFDLGLGFGGGMGKQGKTCGAVTGAYTVIGLWSAKQSNKPSEQKRIATEKVREFTQKFVDINGHTSCKSLLGYDMSIPEEAAKINETNVIDNTCPGLVGSAAEILDQILN